MYKKMMLILGLLLSFFFFNACGESSGISSDTNFIPPIVPEILKSFSGTIDENATFGTEVGILDLSNMLVFKRESVILSGQGSENFLIDSNGLILLNKDASIDYETKKTYNLTVTITDIKGNSKATVATIELIDIPENTAVLERFTGTVPENAKASTVIGKLRILTQGDSPIQSMRLDGLGYEKFAISKEGILTVAKGAVLDYESLIRYNLLATAMNTSGESKAVSVNISLDNLGEVVPVIQGFKGTVTENTSKGSEVIGTVVIISSGDSAVTSIQLSGEGKENFEIDNTYGLLSLSSTASIDYEKKNLYTLTATARNSAGESLAQTISIEVINKADVLVSIDNLSLEISENTPINTRIGRIPITEYGDSAISLISLENAGEENFRVDREAYIYVINTLDYETKKEYELSVSVTNNAGISTSKTIKITLTDFPDIPVTMGNFSTNIREGLAVDSIIGKMNISYTGDSDITSIVLSGLGSEHFTIDNKGNISVLVASNYELRKQYDLTAIATNSAGPSTKSFLSISIEDIPDVVPELSLLNADIVENSLRNAIVGRVNIVSVGDRPITGIILTGVGADHFSIDNKGSITVVIPPNFELQNEYLLSAIATNIAGASESVAITISIGDVADIVPVIEGFIGTIVENTLVGTVIGNIVIPPKEDRDKGDREITSITLTGIGAEYFSINTSGAISLLLSPDFEVQEIYSLSIIARNQAGPSLVQKMTITITDLPDKAPVIENLTITVKESAVAGDIVGNIRILKEGDRPIQSITLSEINSHYFEVDTEGIITIASGVSLDYKTIPSYSLVVIAKNESGKSASTSLLIIIEDIPNIVASLSSRDITIVENTIKGTKIGSLSIISQGDRNITSINLSGDDAEHFKVDIHGDIYVVIPPDAESRDLYTLEVVAISLSGSSDMVIQRINITDVIENKPTSESFFARIKNTDTNGTIVGQITVDKKDSDINSVSLSGTGSENFSVAFDGEVTILHEENLLAGAEYNLFVTFSNTAGTGERSSIIIAVDGIDDVRPTILITSSHALWNDAIAYLNGKKWRTEEITYSFEFSEDVIGFTVDDINISGGTIKKFTVIDASHYTALVFPPFNTTDAIILKVDENKTEDIASNPNKASSIMLQTVDTYQEFITEWKTDNFGSTGDTEVSIDVYTTLSNEYNYSIEWGDGSFTLKEDANDTLHSYDIAGTYKIKIKGKFAGITNRSNPEKLLRIIQWGTIEWQSMENAFKDCKNLSGEILDVPRLSTVTNLSNMFNNADAFNEDLNAWDVSRVFSMAGMFQNTLLFNGDISGWTVSNVENMDDMFNNANDFNGYLLDWELSSITSMNRMFKSSATFNDNLSAWNDDITGKGISHTDFNLSATGGLTPPEWE
jgi:hypothetical protein